MIERRPENDIFDTLDQFKRDDVSWRGGGVFGYVYDAGDEAREIAERAYRDFLWVNAIDPMMFPSALTLERELVRIGVAHLHGGADAVGNFTSGGTESILLAVKAARDYARNERAITAPEMIVPTTAHAAFHKAARYLGVKLVACDVDPETLTPSIETIEAAITEDTILLVASAPSYAHGVIDPIEAIGAVAQKRGLLFHVDACIGGFLLPFLEELGEPVPPFDFRVAGVSSISMDLHKYAFTPKGASLVLYRDADLRRYQLFACAEWTGYTIVNTTVQSSRSAAPMAAAWAVLHHFGHEGYLEQARVIRDTSRAITRGLREIPGVSVLGQPAMGLFAFTTGDDRLFHIADRLRARGFHVQPQLAFRGVPASLHLSVSPGNASRVDDLLRAVADAVLGTPIGTSQGIEEMVQAAGLTGSPVDKEVVARLLQVAGVTGDQGTQLPSDTADINALLSALPPELNAALLTAFVGELYR